MSEDYKRKEKSKQHNRYTIAGLNLVKLLRGSKSISLLSLHQSYQNTKPWGNTGRVVHTIPNNVYVASGKKRKITVVLEAEDCTVFVFVFF